MNKARRKELAKAISFISDALDILCNVRDEENEAFINLPESLMDGERGSRMSEIIDSLDEQCSNLEDAVSAIEECSNSGNNHSCKWCCGLDDDIVCYYSSHSEMCDKNKEANKWPEGLR